MNNSDGFIIFAESARQTTGKDDSDELDQSDANANAAEQERLIVQKLKQLRQASDFRCVVRCAMFHTLG